VKRIAPLMFAVASLATAQGDSVRARPVLSGSIDGLVSDSALVPLNDVTVSVVGSEIRVVTGENGRFRILAMPPGRHRLLARRIGKEPSIVEVDVVAGETAHPAILLEPVARTLGTVRVETNRLSAKLREFDVRSRGGEGQYLTGDQIIKRNVVEVGDLFGGMRGVHVYADTAFNVRGGMGSARCAMQILVDGMRHGVYLAALPPPSEIAGIEIYLGPATTPPQYQSKMNHCGIILIWLRDGSESYARPRKP
jgi:hypothetical protein